MLEPSPSITDVKVPHDDGTLSLRRLGSEQAGEALDTWRLLEQQQQHTPLAASCLWTETWLRHFGDLVPHEFLIAESQGTPRGICLLTHGVGQSLGPLPLRSVHLGTAGEPDADSVCVEYNGLLTDDTARAAFSRQIIEHVEQDATWDQFQLDGFSPDEADALLQAIPTVDIERRPSRFFDFQVAREADSEVLPLLGRSTRSNIRRRLRDYGELTVEWVESLTQAEEVFSELVSLHQARWTAVGKPGVFASSRFHDFQLELLTHGLNEQRVVLFRVRQGDQTIGCLFLLVDRNRLLDYLSGFASFTKNASPGLIVHYLCMQEAHRRGYDAYDFLVGDLQHKRNLSNAQNELRWATWRRDRLKFRAADIVRRVKRAITRNR